MFSFMDALPLWVANVSAIVFFLGVVALVWALPRKHVYGNARVVVWKDLRVWATVLLSTQCVVYAIF